MTTNLSKTEYQLLAAFRYALRQFLHFSEASARAVGVEPQQHQALLAIKGFPERSDHDWRAGRAIADQASQRSGARRSSGCQRTGSPQAGFG